MKSRLSTPGDVKGSLDVLLQVGTWLVAVIVLFVVTPPRLTPADDGLIFVRAAQFIVAVILALAIVAIRRGDLRLRTLFAASAISLLAAVMALFTYRWLLSDRTCDYDTRGPMVIGKTMLPGAGQHVLSVATNNCEALIQDVAGNTGAIWPHVEIISNYLLLSAAFIATVILFALSAIFAVASLKKTDK